MATSEAEVCNAALALIGHTAFIAALTDTSTEAQVCAALYSATRDEVLREWSWPFATRRVSPSPLASVTRSDWLYAFAYPGDCIAMRKIETGQRNERKDQEVPYARESDAAAGQVILTDEKMPEFVYTARINDVAQWPSDFADAVSWRLAYKLASALRKDPRLMAGMQQGYAAALANAYENVSGERGGEAEPTPYHISVR